MTDDVARRLADIVRRFNQPIVESLMVTFPMIMNRELRYRVPQHVLAKEHETIEALAFYRSYEPFRKGVQIGRPGR